MIDNSKKKDIKKNAYNKNVFTIPAIISAIGFVICFIASVMSENVNMIAFSGYTILSVGTILVLNALVKERYRLGIKIGFPLKMIFPPYPVVEDFDDLTRSTTEFRSSYSEFLNSGNANKENSNLQNYGTQFLWHCLYLQKKRMKNLGVQMELESNRRSYCKDFNGIRSKTYFDGRYNVNNVHEEIYAIRTFRHSGRTIKKVYDKEVAHYTFLSAKNAGKDDVVCPNCGNISSRSNLIDGCDFCQTKFTVEDLENRVSNFAFRRDFQASEGRRKAIKKLIYPWIYMIGMMPMMYIGFFLPFLYGHDMNVFLRFGLGLFCALGLGFGGFAVCSFALFFIVPIVALVNNFWGVLNDKLVYRSEEELDRDNKIANQVRKSDSLFSLQSFFGSVQNKLYTIHFADNTGQINAFSDCDISKYLQKYKDVVDIDTLSVSMDSYQTNKGMQIAEVSAELLLREFKNSKIKDVKENVTICLEKSESCKTQAICGPSVLSCKSCGSSLSLMDGKTCKFCGTELNMREHDWVITRYTGSQMK